MEGIKKRWRMLNSSVFRIVWMPTIPLARRGVSRAHRRVRV